MTMEDSELVALMSRQDLETLIAQSSCTIEDIPELLAKTAAPMFSEDVDYIDSTVVWHLLSAIGYGVHDEFLGLCSQRVPLGSTELMVARAMHEPTLGEAIRAFATAANILWPDVQVETRIRLDELHFCMSCKNEYQDARQIYLELASVPFYCIFRWLADADFPVLRFRIARNRPSRVLHVLAALDSCVLFDGQGVDIVLPRSVAELPIVARNLPDWRADIYRMFQNILEKRRSRFTASNLQSYVRSALRSGVRSQDLIAASAGISVATLRRNLSKERTSFREISDHVFRQTVENLLSSGVSVEHAAERMHYADARSFRRAFQRVFGVNPSTYRESRCIR